MSTPLVHAALRLRRATRVSIGFVAAIGLAGALVFGAFEPPVGLGHAICLAAFLAVAWTRLRTLPRPRAGGIEVTSEIGVLGLVLVHAIVQAAGGSGSLAYVLVYLWAAIVGALAARREATLLLVWAFLLGTAVHFARAGTTLLPIYALHSVLTLSFGALTILVTRAEIASLRRHSRKERDEEREKLRFESRLLRLSAGASGANEERLHRSSLEEVHNQLYHVLSLLSQSLDLHTALLLILDERQQTLRIVELVTDSEDIAEGPFRAGEGAVGAVAKRGLVTNLEHVRPGYAGICYYRGPTIVRAFLGVPVMEGSKVWGALCIDRLEDRPFTAKEEGIASGAARQLVRALENERVFVQLERSKNEMSTLYRASTALGAALDEDAVIKAGLDAARELAPFDLGVVSLYDAATRKHSIRKAIGEGAENLGGLTFRDNTSLTAMAIKNRHYLPYRGDFDPAQQTVFTRRTNFEGMQSLLILPLVVRENAMGTMVLAARRDGAFSESIRPTLQVLANQVAVAMSSAASVRHLEEMATTDGLTGCLNKRAFRDELGSKLRAAARFNRPVSLIVTDLDHFKSVNDTYGHATGDLVLRELGNILRRMKRETDVVARFGGEEFCVLCEETDTVGAMQLAERVREALGATLFQTEMGQLQLTCSLGVATYPTDARSEEDLFEAADRALYQAKNKGRNRSCAAPPLRT